MHPLRVVGYCANGFTTRVGTFRVDGDEARDIGRCGVCHGLMRREACCNTAFKLYYYFLTKPKYMPYSNGYRS